MDNQNMVYMAYDGDNAGRMCGRAILADNTDALHEISQRINLGHEVVKRWVEAHGGQFISGGGDEGVFSIPMEAISNVEELRADYEYATNLTATIGIGNSLSEAGKAMLVGKFRGKNTVVQYDPSIEQEIRQAQSNMASGTASQEEKKIGEAYLQPEGTVGNMEQEMKSEDGHDCPYCQQMDSQQMEDPSHCRYCHDAEQAEPCSYCADSSTPADDGCPYCAENAAPADDCPYCAGSGTHNAAAAGHPQDCPYCQDSQGSSAAPSEASIGSGGEIEPTAGPTVQNPTTIDSEDFAGQDLRQPDLPKPDPIVGLDGQGSTRQDTPTNENIKLEVEGQGENNETTNEAVEAADPQSEETVEAIAQQLEETPPAEQTEAPAQEQIDSADMAVGTEVQANVSRPTGYEDEDSDMALEEDNVLGTPNVTSLMSEGLDSHADSIRREKVIAMVSQALEGFKGCKGIIEKAQVQAPQLYQSSIAMLKAMIEMARMLGLDQEANPENPLEDQNPSSNDSAGALPTYAPKEDNGVIHDAKESGNTPVYANKEDGAPAGKQKGQLANQ